MIYIYRTNSLRCNTNAIVESAFSSDFNGQTVFVAPESSKAAVERIVVDNAPSSSRDALGICSSFVNGDVVSFLKLASRINEMCGNFVEGCGDSIVLRTAIYRILFEHHDEFLTFGKFVGRFEYIDSLIDLLGDFTRYGIDADGIASAYEASLEDDSDPIYRDKIHDFKLLSDYLFEISSEYNLPLLSNQICEANKLLNRLINCPELLNSRRYREFGRFVSSRFVVIGFGATRLLTPQEIEFIYSLHRLGATFCFYPISSDGFSSDIDTSVFVNGDEFISSIVRMIPETIVNDFFVEDEVDQVLKVASNNYALKKKMDVTDIIRGDSIKRVAIANLDDRIGYIGNEIIKLTRQEGYRYKDIRIVCVDDSILDRLRSVFSRFGLSSFIDRKILVTNTPVFRFIELLVELPIRYFALEDVLSILRTGLLPVLTEDVDAFENYCVKNNIIDGRRMFDIDYFSVESKYDIHLYREGEDVPASGYLWNNIVERVLMPLHDVAISVSNEPTIASKSRVLAEYIDGYASVVEVLAEELVDRKDTDRASALVRGYKEVMSLLVSFTSSMNDIAIKQEYYLALIRIDMRNKSQGTIPLMIDSVDIVSPEQAYVTSCKVMFIIGATSENFPYRRINEGLMTAGELKKLSADSKTELPDKFQNRTRTEFITSAIMMNSVNELLYFVNDYSNQDSSVYDFFSDYSSEDLKINCFIDNFYGTSITRRHDFMTSEIDPSVMPSILGKEQYISVSSLERFNSCHLKYMLQDILKIKEREDGRNVKASSMGTIIHHMFQKYFEDLKAKNLSSSDYIALYEKLCRDKAELSFISEKYLNDYCGSSKLKSENTDQFRIYPGLKARRIFEYSLPYMLEEIGTSGYLPDSFELNIKKEGKDIHFSVGETDYRFIGYIDRVDRQESTGNLRVIDYKTGDKAIKLKKTLAGVQMQLFGYANALADLGSVNDVGYFPIGLKAGNGTDIVIEPKLAQLSDADFNTVCEYVNYSIIESCKDINSGKADALVNPVSIGDRLECAFCPYASCCGNCKSNPLKKKINKLDKSKPTDSDYIDEMRKRMGNS